MEVQAFSPTPRSSFGASTAASTFLLDLMKTTGCQENLRYFSFVGCQKLVWRQDNRNRSNQESKFDFVATHQLRKIDGGQQKIKIVRTNLPANQFSPSAGTTLLKN